MPKLFLVMTILLCFAEAATVFASAEELNPKFEYSNSIVPDWLVQSLSSKLNNKQTTTLSKHHIKLIQLYMRASKYPQLAAYVTNHHGSGIFVLYDWTEGEYQEVYELRKPVYDLQLFNSGEYLAVAYEQKRGFNYAKHQWIVLKHTARGYKEVWEGLAVRYKMTASLLPYVYDLGSITIDGDKLYYWFNKQTYRQADSDQPEHIETHHITFRYHPLLHRFVLN